MVSFAFYKETKAFLSLERKRHSCASIGKSFLPHYLVELSPPRYLLCKKSKEVQRKRIQLMKIFMVLGIEKMDAVEDM